MVQTIAASVGRLGGANRPGDVKTVQELLNRVPQMAGGPWPLLAVDSLCGPRTVDAIQKFQIKQLGFGKADGRVDPNGPTLRKLNEVSSSGWKMVLTSGTVLTCPHGGAVVATQTTPGPVGPDGHRALRSTDRFDVVGCPFTGSLHCVRVQWAGFSNPLTRDSLGFCVNGAGFPTGRVIIHT